MKLINLSSGLIMMWFVLSIGGSIGLALIGLGSLIYFQQAADLVNVFNDKKHNKAKASIMFGKYLTTIGIMIILISATGIF
ncbi:hypothetical protein ACS127_08735 [Amphibacillus sp. Q70]|uniref:hypothetical protein n=1 Tax=Amphibacillus sp. Q70 TaxID=3453416 RepID=UPI003F857188